MTLGLHDHRKSRRRRVRWTVFKWTVVISGILGAGIFAYETGSGLAQRKVTDLNGQITELTAKLEALEKENTELGANTILVRKKLGQAEARYRKDVPTGRMAKLLGQVQRKLEAGVELGRIEFVVNAVENPRSCDDAPVTKRFIVKTPYYEGANDSVSFAKSAITITAAGEPSRDAQGNVQAWFDPAKPVTLQLTRIGGKTSAATGLLPLHASVVAGGSEYRYSAVPGPQGFIKITGDRCQYP